MQRRVVEVVGYERALNGIEGLRWEGDAAGVADNTRIPWMLAFEATDLWVLQIQRGHPTLARPQSAVEAGAAPNVEDRLPRGKYFDKARQSSLDLTLSRRSLREIVDSRDGDRPVQWVDQDRLSRGDPVRGDGSNHLLLIPFSQIGIEGQPQESLTD